MGRLHDAIKAEKPEAEVLPLITPEAAKEKDFVRHRRRVACPRSRTLSPRSATLSRVARALGPRACRRSPPLAGGQHAAPQGRLL